MLFNAEAANYTQGKIDDASEWVSDKYKSAKDMVGQMTMPGWVASILEASKVNETGGTSEGQNTKENQARETSKDDSNENRDENKDTNNHESNNGDNNGDRRLLVAATGAVLSGTDEERQEAITAQMMLLTKKMIEIRSILQQIDQSRTIQLPSIVVIGSQSSGKSSVLEAIVGHEFLPKGSNMVTRRPIELTLINSPEATAEYGEFPALKMSKITDFSVVQRTLTDLNLAVPESEAISDDPIKLNIYSPNVPDLTLIDLPGYIQLAASDQPEALRSKITELCDRYIAAPNIILAISSADVDLANSTALRASRRVDPRGERTIGVVTKMDLVDPIQGVNVLTNKSYPLRMGYVGVISRAPSLAQGLVSGTSGIFGRATSVVAAGAEGTNLQGAIARHEADYFGRHAEFKDGLVNIISPVNGYIGENSESGRMTLGVLNLRNKLMAVLEETMAKSLRPTADAIHQELEEATYQFKVEYNDRPLTAESYLAQSLDSFKVSFKDFASKFGREQVRELLKNELDQRVLDLVAQRYWNNPPGTARKEELQLLQQQKISELANSSKDDIYWRRQLDTSLSNLTKSGIGRIATTLVSTALSNEMDYLLSTGAFKTHPYVKTIIQDATAEILNSRFYSTADQVENCIKPYKYEVDVEDREWNRSREHAFLLLKEELRQCEEAHNALKKSVGAKKLGQVEAFVERFRRGSSDVVTTGKEANEVYGFSQALVARGREAVFLKDRAAILGLRMTALKSKQCRTKDNRYKCPEIFLDVVAHKLTQTAVLFLNVELLSDFYYHFPRELDRRLGGGGADGGTMLGREQIRVFATEDPKVKRHIELQERKQLLELALEKVEGVMAMQRTRIR